MPDYPFDNNSSPAERRRILAEERRGQTFQGQAMGADLDLGGRFAKVLPTTVTAASPGPIYPQQPGTSPSNQAALVPDEPPLGWSVEAQEPVGEVFERNSTPVAPAVESVGSGKLSGIGPATQPFKRRL